MFASERQGLDAVGNFEAAHIAQNILSQKNRSYIPIEIPGAQLSREENQVMNCSDRRFTFASRNARCFSQHGKQLLRIYNFAKRKSK